MKQINITLKTGETHEIPFGPNSTLTVRSLVDNGAGQAVEKVASFGEVAAVEIVDGPETEFPYAQIVQESPHLSSPQTVLQFAQSGPVGDAAGLVEQAVSRYPDDPQIAEAKAVIAQRMAGDGAAVAATTDSSNDTADVAATPAVADLHDEAVQTAQQRIARATDPAAETPTVDHLAQAVADVDAALAIYPDSVELADAKSQLEEMHAAATQSQGS